MSVERFGVLRKYLTRGTEAWNLQVRCLAGVLSKSKFQLGNLIKPYLKMKSKKGGSDICSGRIYHASGPRFSPEDHTHIKAKTSKQIQPNIWDC